MGDKPETSEKGEDEKGQAAFKMDSVKKEIEEIAENEEYKAASLNGLKFCSTLSLFLTDT
jgi:hypothetical protein